MSARRLGLLFTASTLLCAGCSEARKGHVVLAPKRDGGVLLDGAVGSDGGFNTSDAGPVTDGGLIDTGVARDAGTPVRDAGSLRDAGVARDAGSLRDAGPVRDAGPRDAGPAPACQPSFGAADACGGVPIGNWTYTEACSDVVPYANLLAMCPGATPSNVQHSPSGSLEITPAGNYIRNVQIVTTGDVFVPVACTQGFGCGLLGTFLPQLIPGATATCTNVTGGCDCAVTGTESINDSGTITFNGGVATTVSNGQTNQYWYCDSGGLSYRGMPTNTTDGTNAYVLVP